MKTWILLAGIIIFSGFSAAPGWSKTTADEATDNQRQSFEERRQ
jgi:hypothetical protein